MDAFSRLRPSSGIIFYIAAAYMSFIAVSARLFAPGMRYTDLLSRRLAAEIPAAKRLCLIGLALYLRNLRPPLESILNPDWAASPQLRQFLASAEPGKRRSAAPILLLQGGRDDAIPAHVTGLLFGRLCRLGNVVQYRVYAGADHATILTQAYPAMARWLADRLAGRPARRARGGVSCAPGGVTVTG